MKVKSESEVVQLCLTLRDPIHGVLCPWDFLGKSTGVGRQCLLNGDCSHEIKRCLLLGRRAMTNLDSILKGRDTSLPAKVYVLKATVFPVVVYGCES